MLEILKYLSLFFVGITIPFLLSIIVFRTKAISIKISEKLEAYAKVRNIFSVFILISITVSLFFLNIHSDIIVGNKLLLNLSLLVSLVIIFLAYRRIEIVLIIISTTCLSWYWTYSFGALCGLRTDVNYLQILLGLHVGYSMFLLKNLIHKNKFGNAKSGYLFLNELFLILIIICGIIIVSFSSQTQIKELAQYGIIGIVSLLFINYTIPPILFRILTKQKGQFRKEPLTFLNSLTSIFSLLLFIIESIILTLLIPLLYILPLPRKNVKYVAHILINLSSKFIIWVNFNFSLSDVNREKIDFSKPSVIVSNHQSHLDLMLILRLHPKIIVITNKWVWNNPIYGLIVRFADYYPVYNGIDADFEKIKKKVAKGYSVLIFPEGGRTPDGKIKRYHQGAFKIAQELNLDIQPILIHGAFQCLPKTEFFLRAGNITLKYFDKIKVDPINIENNETYRLQAKALTKLMRKKFKKLALEKENTHFYSKPLINQFIYKGHIIESATRRTLKLVNNYSYLNQIIPLNASIVEIGCGYGYLSLMLKYISGKRQIIGFDYSYENIEVANQARKDRSDINFSTCNITKEPLPTGDVFILNQFAKSLTEQEQSMILTNCYSKLTENGMIIIRGESPKLISFKDEIVTEASSIAKFSCKKIIGAEYPSSITYIIKNE